jgi:hypothetical protein
MLPVIAGMADAHHHPQLNFFVEMGFLNIFVGLEP